MAATEALTGPVESGGNALASTQLAEKARAYAASAKAPSTRKAYRSDWISFESWCATQAVQSLPAEPEAVAVYITTLADAGRKLPDMVGIIVDS